MQTIPNFENFEDKFFIRRSAKFLKLSNLEWKPQRLSAVLMVIFDELFTVSQPTLQITLSRLFSPVSYRGGAHGLPF
jgi:hypothetical protein